MPTISGGTDLDAFVDIEFDALPPHRAAIPVPPIILSDVPDRNAGARFRLSLLAAVGLHGGLLVAVLLWGQGGELPPPEIVTVELVENAGRIPNVTRMALDLVDTKEAVSSARVSDGSSAPDETASALAETTAAQEVPATAPRSPFERQYNPPAVEADEDPLSPAAASPRAALEQQSTAATIAPASDQQSPETAAGPDAGVPDALAGEAETPSRRSPETIARLRAMLAARSIVPDGDPSAPAQETTPLPGDSIGSAAPRRGERQTHPLSSAAERIALAVYQRRVRARIVSHLPVGNLGSGWVRIGLQLSPTGTVRGALVLRSSGNGAIDRAALASVRRASPYPRPPAGATAAQLALSFVFKFE